MSSPQIKISPCTLSDLNRCFEITSLSFSNRAVFVNAYFPAHSTTLGRQRGAERFKAWIADPDSTFLKATIPANAANAGQQTKSPSATSVDVDGGDGEGMGDGEIVVGTAIWTLMHEPPSADLAVYEDLEATWEDGVEREWMRRLWRSYVVPRASVVGREKGEGRGVWVLELLAVHPDYQRLGAGTALTSWGTQKADEQGLEAVVEATHDGRRTYEKCGFTAEIEDMAWDVGEEYQRRELPRIIFMTRSRKIFDGVKNA